MCTKSRYGLRLLMDMARHYDHGPVQLGEIAKRQDISVKYLEQIIIPLKKAHYITSLRGRKGGHVLNKPPGEISVGNLWPSWRRAPLWLTVPIIPTFA